MWFLFSHLRLRGAWLRDPFHRLWNDWKLSVSDMGWTTIVNDGLSFLNFRFAPYLSQAFWGQMLEALRSWCQRADVSDVIFSMLYPLICRDKQIDDSPDFGSFEHCRETLLNLPVDQCFARKGCKVAKRSFWAWPVRMWEELRSWHSILAVLMHLGLRTGSFSSDALPLFGPVLAPTAELSMPQRNQRGRQSAARCGNPSAAASSHDTPAPAAGGASARRR